MPPARARSRATPTRSQCDSAVRSDMNCDARDGDQEERCKHSRNVESKTRFNNAVGEARTLPGGAGGDLRHDGADQRKPAADAQSGEEIWQRRRQPEQHELLETARPVHVEQIDEIVVGGRKAERGVGEKRKERDQEGAHQHRDGGRQIDQEQRRDGDDRRHLHRHGEGVERPLDEPRLGENDRQRHASDDRREKSLQRDRQRHPERGREGRPVGEERGDDDARAPAAGRAGWRNSARSLPRRAAQVRA